MPRAPRNKAGSAAFTLVELLVVIGIIAILIGILMPALSAARKQAATAKCLANLRSIGQAFQLYANHYRDAFPVVRQDTPDDGGFPPNGLGPQNIAPPAGANRYYTDMLLPFLSKTGKMNFEVASTDVLSFKEARESVMWGCPEWEGWQMNVAGQSIDGVIKFDSGYAMNFYPTYQTNYPASPTTKLTGKDTAMRWGGSNYIGKYYKRSQWTRASERLLMSDANLWLLDMFPTAGAIQAQVAERFYDQVAGGIQIDRYRHGKYPATFGSSPKRFRPTGGKQAFNILYVDGHAATVFNIKEGYKAIRMRYPGP